MARRSLSSSRSSSSIATTALPTSSAPVSTSFLGETLSAKWQDTTAKAFFFQSKRKNSGLAAEAGPEWAVALYFWTLSESS